MQGILASTSRLWTRFGIVVLENSVITLQCLVYFIIGPIVISSSLLPTGISRIVILSLSDQPKLIVTLASHLHLLQLLQFLELAKLIGLAT